MPTILLCGEDSFRLHERHKELVLGFRKKYDPSGLNILMLSGENAKPGEVKEALMSAGFLGSKRLVAITGLFSEGKAKDFYDIFTNSKLGEDSVLILSEPASRQELEKNSSFSKLDKKHLKIEEFSPLRGKDLNVWIRNEFKKAGGDPENSAVAILEKAAGNDLWLLKQEISKLAAYANGRKITAGDVGAMLNVASDENIFEFLDAIGARDAKRASETLHRELQAVGGQAILYQLVRQFRIFLLLEDCTAGDRGPANADLLAKKLGVHPFVIKKSLNCLSNFTRDEIIKILGLLLFLDKAIKTGASKEFIAFDLFLAKILYKS